MDLALLAEHEAKESAATDVGETAGPTSDRSAIPPTELNGKTHDCRRSGFQRSSPHEAVACNAVTDPKGYYAALGLEELCQRATSHEIKVSGCRYFYLLCSCSTAQFALLVSALAC